MITLKSFHSAAFIQEKMREGDVFATVIDGKYKDTVGKIQQVVRKHYDRHEYYLEVGGKSLKFCGGILKQSSVHEVTLKLNQNYQREFRDFNERIIALNNVLIITKQSKQNCSNEVMIGTVRKIDDTGVFVAPFAVNGLYTNESTKYVRVVKTNSAIILDESTRHACMVQRLSAA
ncbi:hypothetical protein D3C87_732970 [compost metagenome]